MNRFHQLLLIGTFLPFCWLAMMIVHELGHVIGAAGTGGTVTKVVLHPLSISRTDVWPNPQPTIVVWAGPLVGVLLPLGLSGFFKWQCWPFAYLVEFFAGFCLIANGAYIGIGSFERVGDAGDMLRHGCPMWTLWLFGLATLPLGLLLWNGLGSHFGLGRDGTAVDRRAAYLTCALLAVTVIVELLLSPR